MKKISHQMTANRSQERRNAAANTKRVHLHWASTRVVKMSWRNRKLLRGLLDWSMLHSPFLKIALLRTFLTAPGLNCFLEIK